jgi:hypothetical protein
MFSEATNALVAAWLFTALLGWAKSLPTREDGRPAVSMTVVSLFLLAWAGGPYLSAILGIAPSNPFAYAFIALLTSAALSTLARPVPPPPEFESFSMSGTDTMIRLPNRKFAMLMGSAGLAVLARYATLWQTG